MSGNLKEYLSKAPYKVLKRVVLQHPGSQGCTAHGSFITRCVLFRGTLKVLLITRPGRRKGCREVFCSKSLGEEGLSGEGEGRQGLRRLSAGELTHRLSRSNRGRCGVLPGYPVSSARAAGPGVCTIACSGVSTVLWGRAPRSHSLTTQATRARVSSSAGRRPSMRRSEGEAKCGHKACAV